VSRLFELHLSLTTRVEFSYNISIPSSVVRREQKLEWNSKEHILMPQQMNFDEINRDESASYAAGYEIPRNRDEAPGWFGQKLSGQEAGQAPTAGQRLALAIVSLLLLMLMFLAMAAITFVHVVDSSLAAAFVLIFLAFFVATIVINLVFNRRR
jgi:hypothetical protein